jgi:hypothetical protein
MCYHYFMRSLNFILIGLPTPVESIRSRGSPFLRIEHDEPERFFPTQPEPLSRPCMTCYGTLGIDPSTDRRCQECGGRGSVPIQKLDFSI